MSHEKKLPTYKDVTLLRKLIIQENERLAVLDEILEKKQFPKLVPVIHAWKEEIEGSKIYFLELLKEYRSKDS